MRPCADVVPLIGPWLDGELDADDREFVDDHLRGCPSCSARRDLLRAQGDALRERLGARADAVSFRGFADRVLARVQKEGRPRALDVARVWTAEVFSAHRRVATGVASMAVAACAALVVVFSPVRDTPTLLADNHPQIDEVEFGSHDGAVLQLAPETTLIWLSDDRPVKPGVRQ